MDKQEYDRISAQRRKALSSRNYWANASEALTQHADKAKTGATRQDTLLKLAYCQQRTQRAQEDLDRLTQELRALDPAGAITRQIHSAQSHAAKIKRDITHIEQTLAFASNDPKSKAYSYWQNRLADRQEKLTALENRLEQLRAEQTTAAAPVRHEPTTDTLEVIARIRSHDARHA